MKRECLAAGDTVLPTIRRKGLPLTRPLGNFLTHQLNGRGGCDQGDGVMKLYQATALLAGFIVISAGARARMGGRQQEQQQFFGSGGETRCGTCRAAGSRGSRRATGARPRRAPRPAPAAAAPARPAATAAVKPPTISKPATVAAAKPATPAKPAATASIKPATTASTKPATTAAIKPGDHGIHQARDDGGREAGDRSGLQACLGHIDPGAARRSVSPRARGCGDRGRARQDAAECPAAQQRG